MKHRGQRSASNAMISSSLFHGWFIAEHFRAPKKPVRTGNGG
jgi:hypothetical protein